MDKDQYCDEMEHKLTELRSALAERAFPAPASLDAAIQQNENRRLRAEIVGKVDEALAAVAALGAAPAGDAADERADIDRRVSEIEELKAAIR